MIRECGPGDFEAIYEIINDAAQAYKGVIPADRWHDPYMPKDELQAEVAAGVAFLAYEEDGEIAGVMGSQDVQDVTLIRHAYVRTARRNHGIGGELLAELVARTERPVLIGTWVDAVWAVRFYQNRGFSVVSKEVKEVLLRRYWQVPQRQIETSVVLVDGRWRERNQ